MIPSPTNRPKSPKGQPELAKAETQDDGKAKVAAHQSLPGAHQGQHTGTQEY